MSEQTAEMEAKRACALFQEEEFDRAKKQAESKERRERLDRFVAAALTGMIANPSICESLSGPDASATWFALRAANISEAVLAELERREKGGGK